MDIQGNAVEDEDFEPSNYCEHGTFIGNPFGGDYMCGYCEQGITRSEYREILEQRRINTTKWEWALALINLCRVPLDKDHTDEIIAVFAAAH